MQRGCSLNDGAAKAGLESGTEEKCRGIQQARVTLKPPATSKDVAARPPAPHCKRKSE